MKIYVTNMMLIANRNKIGKISTTFVIYLFVQFWFKSNISSKYIIIIMKKKKKKKKNKKKFN